LRAELAKSGCEVELGVELQHLEQFDDNVKVTLLKHNTASNNELVTEEASYEWVIGADGAKGVVRKLLGLKLLGETTTERFVVGDAMMEGLAHDVRQAPQYAVLLFC
jgi:flavin-dependent dehydrogenase